MPEFTHKSVMLGEVLEALQMSSSSIGDCGPLEFQGFERLEGTECPESFIGQSGSREAERV